MNRRVCALRSEVLKKKQIQKDKLNKITGLNHIMISLDVIMHKNKFSLLALMHFIKEAIINQ